MKKRGRAPAMSLTSLHLDGDLPPFFSFVLEGKLAACANFDKEKVDHQLRNLAKRQIGGVIALTEDCPDSEVFEKANMRLLHLPTEDFTAPSIADLEKGVAFITDCNAGGKAVVVHCAQGIGRTGTMLGAYFVIEERMSAYDSIQLVRDRRAGSIHKKGQELRLYELEEAILGTSSKPEGFEVDDSSPRSNRTS
eukprot:TRINITY_DN1737_c1_g1_i1.p1 TRINITY_DN1737_c1_g1~~TRINITY_DN1737_c1_g1_i1.p1  ORF type:complete len:194 (+),score=58.29 TRINITY_DN1737_c1_g1_i1:129-710(+)